VEALRSYTDNNPSAQILLVGVNYDKETKVHTCVIEELER
jgi:aminoglycoside N3'-acetyltransferase